MLKRNKKTKKLRFEGLENRTLMAGDVNVYIDEIGHLGVWGDAADNAIEIKQSGKAWQVKGIDTTVNGHDSAQTFTGVRFDIYVDLGAGNDTVNASKGKLPSGTFHVADGGGTTVVNLSKITASYVRVQTGDASDAITIDNCSANAFLIDTCAIGNADADVVTIVNSNTFDGGVGIVTGGGNDVVTIKSVAVAAGCLIDTSLAGESDQDRVSVKNLRTRRYNLEVLTGDGSDEVTLANCKINVRVRIVTATTSADGNDTVTLQQIKSGESITVETGNGTDTATLTNLAAKVGIGVDMGQGYADQLRLAHSHAIGTILLGGDGLNDTVSLSQNKWKKKGLNVIEFELQG
jgi:hypothetical protein